MEVIIFIGLQGSGKSTFFKQRFINSHIRLNLDMLRTRNRERILLAACLEAKQPFAVDNTNPTQVDRQRYIAPAKAAGFSVVGCYFPARLEECLEHNRLRPADSRVPELAIKGTAAKMTRPAFAEGFDRLLYVRKDGNGGFAVEEHRDEI